jgi:hypothetical protein
MTFRSLILFDILVGLQNTQMTCLQLCFCSGQGSVETSPPFQIEKAISKCDWTILSTITYKYLLRMNMRMTYWTQETCRTKFPNTFCLLFFM